MARRRPFVLIYDSEVRDHLQAIRPEHHGVIRMAIEEQLRHEPDRESRNRKPLQRPLEFGGTWELRLGPENRFRVFCAVDHEHREVQIPAIGTKERNRLTIGREEIEL